MAHELGWKLLTCEVKLAARLLMTPVSSRYFRFDIKNEHLSAEFSMPKKDRSA